MSNIGAHLLSSVLMIGGIIVFRDRKKWWVWSHTDHIFAQAVWRQGTIFNNPPSLSSGSQLSLIRLAERSLVWWVLEVLFSKGLLSWWTYSTRLTGSNIVILGISLTLWHYFHANEEIGYILYHRYNDCGGGYLSNCQYWRVRRETNIAFVISPILGS